MALLAAQSVDLALVDLRMPRHDGLEVLLTVHADAGNTIEAMKLGAFDALAKPIGRADIVDVLRQSTRHRHALRATRKQTPSR